MTRLDKNRRPIPILSNLARLSVAHLVVKPLWFVFITAVCMRMLGVEDYGIFAFSLALATIFASLSDFGTCDFMIRAVSRDRSTGTRYFSNLAIARVIISGIATACAIAVASTFGHGTMVLIAVGWAAVYALSLRLCEFCRGFFRAHERLGYEAFSIVTEKILVIGGGTLALVLYPSPGVLLFGMAGGMILTLLVCASLVHARFAPFSVSALDGSFTIATLRASFPLGLNLFFAILLLHSTVPLVELFSGPTAAGYFAAPLRIVESLLLIPGIAAAALLPRLSKLFAAPGKEAFASIFWRSVLALGGVSVAIAAVLSLAAAPVIELLAADGEFGGAVPVLAVLAWVFPVMTLQYVVSLALIASNQQWPLARIMGLGAVAIGIASVLLVPAYGAVGGALALGAAYLTVLLMSGWWLHLTLRRREPDPTRVETSFTEIGETAA